MGQFWGSQCTKYFWGGYTIVGQDGTNLFASNSVVSWLPLHIGIDRSSNHTPTHFKEINPRDPSPIFFSKASEIKNVINGNGTHVCRVVDVTEWWELDIFSSWRGRRNVYYKEPREQKCGALELSDICWNCWYSRLSIIWPLYINQQFQLSKLIWPLQLLKEQCKWFQTPICIYLNPPLSELAVYPLHVLDNWGSNKIILSLGASPNTWCKVWLEFFVNFLLAQCCFVVWICKQTKSPKVFRNEICINQIFH